MNTFIHLFICIDILYIYILSILNMTTVYIKFQLQTNTKCGTYNSMFDSTGITIILYSNTWADLALGIFENSIKNLNIFCENEVWLLWLLFFFSLP